MKLSIVLPTMNRLPKLLQSIALVRLQRYSNWELIIIDDSIVDNSEKINSIGEPRVRYLHRKGKSGVSSARNEGVNLCTGTYLIFLDDDDSMDADWLHCFERLALNNNLPELLLCGFKVTSPNESGTLEILPSGTLWKVIFPGTFAIKIEFMKLIGGYDTRILYGENTELFFRIRSSRHRLASSDEVHFHYIQSLDGGSKNLHNLIQSHCIVLEKHRAFFSQNQDVKKFYLRMVGVALLKLGRFNKARSYLYESYCLGPFEGKALLRLVLSYIPFLARRVYPFLSPLK